MPLRNATATVVDNQGVEIIIQHKYEKLNGNTWFPTQLNTDFKMLGLNLGGFNISKELGTTYNKGGEFEDEGPRYRHQHQYTGVGF